MRLLKIGRDNSCNITIPNPRVSALHAELIVLNNGDILLEDKGSTHGTTVNGQRLTPGKQTSVRRGDRITFADSELNWNDVPPTEDNSAYDAIYGIGTNFRNEIRLAGNRISRFHATLKHGKDGKWYIQDHSKNGTLVNGAHIASGQNVRIKKGDSVTCGGEVVDLSQYLGSHGGSKSWIGWAGGIVGAAALIALAIIFWPAKRGEWDKATGCIFQDFHYVVTLNDDPFIQVMKDNGQDWPEKWEFGVNNKGEVVPYGATAQWLNRNPDEAESISITGTGFFVSEDGHILTNRHVARPWEFDETMERRVRAAMGELQQGVLQRPQTYRRLFHVLTNDYNLNEDQIRNWITKFQTSPMEIGGKTDFLAVGQAYKKYTKTHELLPATMLGVSDDKEIDVAVLQLNVNETPKEAKENIIDLKRAIIDRDKINPNNKQDYTYYGYPTGTLLNLDNEKNKGLTPQINNVRISRKPGIYQVEFQGSAMGGASGSPVLDKEGRLIGIMNQAVQGAPISYAVLASHVVDFYDTITKHAVK